MKERTFVENSNLNERQKLTTNLPWIMKQTWKDVLFAHYPVSRKVLEEIVPSQLTVDTFYQTGWISIVPYLTSSMHLRGVPPVPGISTYPGFNIRTYVTMNGKPGVYFFSVNSCKASCCFICKNLFQLPYLQMDMNMKQEKNLIVFESEEKAGLELSCNYRSVSEASPTNRGS